jgi:hypothetical protein
MRGGYESHGNIPLIRFNCGKLGCISIFCTKPCTPYGYYHNTEHAIEYFPYLMEKCEEKKAQCNMVTTEQHIDQNKDEEDDLWVVT